MGMRPNGSGVSREAPAPFCERPEGKFLWSTHQYHKSIKQNASLEKSPTKVTRSQKNHIFASVIAYCKLELLRTKTFLSHFGLKYKLLMKANRMAFLELEKLRFNAGI